MDVMNIDKINIIKRDQVYSCVEIVKTLPRIKRVIIFGSSVTDHCSAGSDLDICLDIEGSTRGLDLFEIAKKTRFSADFWLLGCFQGKNGQKATF